LARHLPHRLNAFLINDLIEPLHFVKFDGWTFGQFEARSNAGTVTFGEHASNTSQAGFVVTAKRPWNPDCSVTWLAGSNAAATQAAGQFLRALIIDGRTP
jgi:hypothetical protein